MIKKKEMQTDYAIVGNSAAGIGAVEGIRSVDRKGSITVVSDEPYRTYSRPLISYYLGGKVQPRNMYYRSKGFYKKNYVNTLLGRRVQKVKRTKKELELSSGDKIIYKKLLLATGGVPFVPPIKDLGGPGVFTFTTWDDAKKLASEATDNKKVVVIGGGLIGLKAVEGLVEIGCDVTVVELADRVLSTILDKQGSDIFTRHLKDLGVNVYTADTVVDIIRHDGKGITGVRLKSGRRISCEIVVVAIGVKPNVELAVDAKLSVDRGIIVDRYMKTSASGIYAAGDVVETYDVLAEVKRPQPIWPNACNQGKIAGQNMAGGKREYDGSFGMNSLEICGLPAITVGLFDVSNKKYQIKMDKDKEKKIYKKLVILDDRIIGAIFIGDIDRAGIITGLIKDKVNISEFKADLLMEGFGCAMFPEELRRERLSL